MQGRQSGKVIHGVADSHTPEVILVNINDANNLGQRVTAVMFPESPSTPVQVLVLSYSELTTIVEALMQPQECPVIRGACLFLALKLRSCLSELVSRANCSAMVDIDLGFSDGLQVSAQQAHFHWFSPLN
jgi:hypothetical protein